jgi:hypothetical protein
MHEPWKRMHEQSNGKEHGCVERRGRGLLQGMRQVTKHRAASCGMLPLYVEAFFS